MKRRASQVTETTPWEEMPLALTVPEVATILRCAACTVHEHIRMGRLPALRLGDGRNAAVFVDRDRMRELFGALRRPGADQHPQPTDRAA